MNWRFLHNLIKSGKTIQGIDLELLSYYGTVTVPCYRIRETVGDYKFDMLRLVTSKRKITIQDDLGLVGLNSLDLSVNHCFLTEGVSDFMSKHFMQVGTDKPNVLGVVQLGGNSVARKILLSLFDNYTVVGDNDVTGKKDIASIRKWLVSEGKSVNLVLPSIGYKDVSLEFMYECESYGYSR